MTISNRRSRLSYDHLSPRIGLIFGEYSKFNCTLIRYNAKYQQIMTCSNSPQFANTTAIRMTKCLCFDFWWIFQYFAINCIPFYFYSTYQQNVTRRRYKRTIGNYHGNRNMYICWFVVISFLWQFHGNVYAISLWGVICRRSLKQIAAVMFGRYGVLGCFPMSRKHAQRPPF